MIPPNSGLAKRGSISFWKSSFMLQSNALRQVLQAMHPRTSFLARDKNWVSIPGKEEAASRACFKKYSVVFPVLGLQQTPNIFITCFDFFWLEKVDQLIFSNISFPIPHRGHTQSSGMSSNDVPGAIPESGSPCSGS